MRERTGRLWKTVCAQATTGFNLFCVPDIVATTKKPASFPVCPVHWPDGDPIERDTYTTIIHKRNCCLSTLCRVRVNPYVAFPPLDAPQIPPPLHSAKDTCTSFRGILFVSRCFLDLSYLSFYLSASPLHDKHLHAIGPCPPYQSTRHGSPAVWLPFPPLNSWTLARSSQEFFTSHEAMQLDLEARRGNKPEELVWLFHFFFGGGMALPCKKEGRFSCWLPKSQPKKEGTNSKTSRPM